MRSSKPARCRNRARRRGDTPFARAVTPQVIQQTPHDWAVGRTFTLTIPLPEPANRGGRPPSRAIQAGKKTPRKATPKTQQAKPRPEPAVANAEAKLGCPLDQERKRPTSPDRKERARKNAREKRGQAKKLGLCRDCSSTAIAEQTRCEGCAAKHRLGRRR